MSSSETLRQPGPVVLLGFAEASAAPEAVWSLVDHGFSVVAFARKGRGCALRQSRYVKCFDITAPEMDFDAALHDLRGLLATLAVHGDRPRLLFPLDDKAVWLCSRVDVESGWELAGPSGDRAALALNKDLQTQAALKAGFNVPRTAVARTTADVLNFSKDESFPLILKPTECVPFFQGRLYNGSKWICANERELDRTLTAWAERVPLLVQPFISGTGEGIFGLAARDGVRALSSHRRLRMMNPQGSGSSACRSQPVPETLKTQVGALIRNAGWRGLFMIELLREPSGKVWFIELNGRPWGSMALSRRQGLEYPAWHLSLYLDENALVGGSTPEGSDLVCRNVGRELMHMLFVLRGPRSTALQNWPSAWTTFADMIRIEPDTGVYNWRRDDPRVLVSDCYYTLRDNILKPKR